MGFKSFVGGSTRDPSGCARQRRSAAAAAVRQLNLVSLPVFPLSLTADTDLRGDEGFVLVSPDAFTRDLTLPAATAMSEGDMIYVKNADSVNDFTLVGTIDGNSNLTMTVLRGEALIAATPIGGSRGWYRVFA